MRLDDASLPAYLADLGLLPEPRGAVSVPGEGNINYVRRVTPDAGPSLIVKQARPELERFPEYRVSPDRLLFEQRFLEQVSARVPRSRGALPQVLHFDAPRRVLVLEDLGPGPDLSTALLAGAVSEAIEELGQLLGSLHARTAPHAAELIELFPNHEMQSLHGEHIFTHPYAENAFPLPEGLAAEVAHVVGRTDLRRAIGELRERYYTERRSLVHADVQSGNLLLRQGRLRLIDAEIAHVGDPAFDLGTALAQIQYHRALRPSDPEPLEAERALERGYLAGGGARADLAIGRRMAGAEMLRRIFGAAREPLMAEPAAARTGLEWASRLVLG